MAREATIIPFPRARNVVAIAKVAEKIAGMDQQAGEDYIRAQLLIQRNTMSRRGIAPETIESELREFESAIRARLFYAILAGEVRRR